MSQPENTVAADSLFGYRDYINDRRLEDEYRAEREKIQMLADEATLKELSEPFPHEVERTLSKGGTSLTYIPVSEVIARLNRVFGWNKWSSEIIKCERDALDPDFIVAHVRLTVNQFGYHDVTKDGFGGQKIKRTKSGDIVDLGDEFKGAVSDALKKAAQQFGIALYLSRTEEALAYEQQADVSPEVDALWVKFVDAAKTLDADGKSALNKYWHDMSGGAPKPKRENATAEMLRALISECEVLTGGGAFREDS